jgi:hypothetical protein
MISGLLYFLALVVIYHNILLMIGLLSRPDPKQHWLAIAMEVAMILLALGAMLSQQMPIFVLGFACYRLATMLESSLIALRQRKAASPLLPVNLLMVSGAFVAYFTEMWWLFVLSYALFWILSFVIGRKLMQRKMHS